ncbi:hypothetical protein ACTMTF_15220 [Nonomuraea sp. ZG12]|uniref:hypothetical protein n=1 Tax=Nonomuraea sp. ZG12 TaxID=3452207 RepID=UPI003F8B5B48
MTMTDALSRAVHVRQWYKDVGANDGEDDGTDAADIIADQLRMLPPSVWEQVLGKAVMHAHEEIHGWGTARSDSVWISGLEYRNAG